VSTLTIRLPAPGGGAFAADAWAYHVGRLTPVRVLDPAQPDGTAMAQGVCRSAVVANDGTFVTLTYDVAEVDPGLIEGLFVEGSIVVSVTA